MSAESQSAVIINTGKSGTNGRADSAVSQRLSGIWEKSCGDRCL